MTTFTLHSHLLSFRIPPIPSPSSNTSIFSTSFKDNNKQFGFSKGTKLLTSRIIVYSSSSSSPKDAASGDNTQRLLLLNRKGETNSFSGKIYFSASQSITFSQNHFFKAYSNSNFCIIEGPETVQDFVQMQLQEIQDNIKSRRNKIFLLMEEVRRLRVQQRLRSVQKVLNEDGEEESYEMPEIQSSIPFLSHVTPKTLKKLYLTSVSFISAIMLFGGLIAPTLELKLGIGGTSYEDFIRNMHLPMQLSQVDPIVASFSGGAVGVISVLMLIEASNVEKQEKKMCKYCRGTGYLACARCSASGVCLNVDPISVSSASVKQLKVPTTERCPNCSGVGKVMCPTCLCTGMLMASEHDLRIDPFDI